MFKILDKVWVNKTKNKGFVKYFKNTLWLFFSKGLGLFSTIIVGAWIARYLGPNNYGILTYSKSVFLLFMPLAMIGLNDIVVKELVGTKNHVEKARILGTAFFIKLFFGLLSFILLSLFLLYIHDDFQTKILVVIFSSYLLFQSFEIFDFFFQSEVESKFVVYSRVISVTASGIIKILFIFYEASIYYFAIIMTLELVFTNTITLFFFHKKKISIFLLSFDKILAKDFLSRSWPLFLSGLMYVVYIKVDQIMVKEILGDKSAGLYAVAIDLSEAWYFIPNIIVASLFPAILSSKNKNIDLYNRRMIKLYSLLFWMAMLISLFVTFFGNTLISYLYGVNFKDSDSILTIYIWSNTFYFLITASSKWLVSEGYYLHSFYRNIFGAILNIIFNLLLLKKYGLQGAAISTLISYSFVGIFYDLFFKKLRINLKLKLKAIACIKS